jgi:WD40 repeat protein
MVSEENKPRPKSVTYHEKTQPEQTVEKIPNFQDENFQTTFSQNYNENTHFDQCFKDYHLNQRPLSATGLAHTESRPQKDDISKKLHKIRPITANVMNPLISTKRKTNKDKLAENYFGPIPKVLETVRPASLHEVEDTNLNIHTDLIRKLNIENSDKDSIKNNFSQEHVKVEEMISLPQLREINRHFEKFDGELDLEKFSEVILKVLNLESVRYEKHVKNLFMKIDTNSNSFIDWDQFCSYMQIELQEKERVQLERSRVRFNLPAIKPSLANVQYRDICDVISVCELSDGGFITANVDGTLLFFPKMSKNGAVFPNPRRKVIIPHRNDMISSNSKSSGDNEGGLKKWITDVSVAKKYNKVFVATGDRELLVYDLLSGDPYASLEGLDKLPVRMKVECVEEKIYIVIGDDTGCVSFFEISNASDVLRRWSKRVSVKKDKSDGKSEIKGTISLEEFQSLPNVRHFRSQIHDDWITQIQIVAAARQFLTSSNSVGTSLVITPFTSLPEVGKKLDQSFNLRRDRSQSIIGKDDVLSNNRKIGLRTFSVHKGVKSFSYCKSRLMILTGGLDRMIRQWNPFVPNKPTATLRGHSAPVEMLEIDAVNNVFVSIDMAKNIKVWNLINHTLLTDVYPKSHNISPTEISKACYLPSSETLIVCTDSVFGITMKPRVNLSGDSLKSTKKAHLSIRLQTGTNEAFTHKDPITACVFNPHFNQIITCSSTSVVRIWNGATGELIFEFGGQASSNDGTTGEKSLDKSTLEGHNGAQITSAILDPSGRRLITTGRDGKTCIWNPNSGACLKTLLTVGSRRKEVHDCVAITINHRNTFICTVGWERRVRLYSDHKTNGDYKQIQNPSMSWSEDIKNGHRDDIVAVAYCPPHLLATVDYSGMLFIWNIVSGHISKRIKYEPKSQNKSESLVESRQIIHSIVGLPKRHLENEASITEQFTSRPNTRQTGVSGTSSKGTQMSAVLAIGTCDGFVSFYTNLGKCYASICMTEREKNVEPPAVTTLNVSKDECLLIIGDADGYITMADITSFARVEENNNSSGECKKPLILKRWRAHITSVVSICPLLRKPVEIGIDSDDEFEDNNQLVSISSDKRARVWSFAGHFIGTLGQGKQWDSVMADTWQHPSQPEDVLFHHASMPKSLGRINEDINSEPLDYLTVSDQLFEQSTQDKSSEFKQQQHDTAMNNTYTRKQATTEEIELMIKNFELPSEQTDSGKQLRAVTMKSNRAKTLNNPARGDAAYVPMCDNAVFRKLLTFDLVDAPSPKGKDAGRETRLLDDGHERVEVKASRENHSGDVSVSGVKAELDAVKLKPGADDGKTRTVKFHIA